MVFFNCLGLSLSNCSQQMILNLFIIALNTFKIKDINAAFKGDIDNSILILIYMVSDLELMLTCVSY